MERQMQDFLTKVAIQTKIENFRDFGKTMEETSDAIARNFDMSLKEANELTKTYWKGDQSLQCDGDALAEKLYKLTKERDEVISRYNLKISMLEDAINGFSIERIAMKNGVSDEEVRDIVE